MYTFIVVVVVGVLPITLPFSVVDVVVIADGRGAAAAHAAFLLRDKVVQKPF